MVTDKNESSVIKDTLSSNLATKYLKYFLRYFARMNSIE